MHYPEISADRAQKMWTQTFQGLDRRPRAGDGTFCAMGNMTGEPWPLLSSRDKRGVVAELENPQGLLAMNELAWIDGTTLYYNGQATPIDDLSLDSDMLPKRMVAMGAYLLVFPDGKYYNTANPEDYGDANRLYSSEGTVPYVYMSDKTGTTYVPRTSGPDTPANPQNEDLWLDTSGGGSVLKRYSNGQWITITALYVTIAAQGIGRGLRANDNVTLSGIRFLPADRSHPTPEEKKVMEQYDALNGTHIVQWADNDQITIIAVVDVNYYLQNDIRADRKLPEMDFVIECNNRLWGCHYGEQDGEKVNRIYASALGDFRVWQRYSGTSQDSYYVDVGSDGPFTAAITANNRPYFFKEKVCHMIYGSRPADWQMQSTEMEGPQEGSGGTLAVYNGQMIYLSRHGVQIYDGTVVPAGEALGYTGMTGGHACVSDNTYYLSVEEVNGSSLYALDCKRGRWHRLDNAAAVGFAALRGETYMLCSDGRLYAMAGKRGTLEDVPVTWYAETAEMGYEYSERHYLRRFLLKMALEDGATCKLSIMYDGDGIWHDKGTMQGRGGVKTYLVPIVPRRCEHCRVRIEGTGKMRLFGVSREIAAGGDGR